MTRTCLVVDDSRVVRKVARRILEAHGFTVAEAENGQQALDSCHMQMPDCVLLDWNMPGRNGLEVCRTLRSESDPDLRDVPVVLLTAHVEAEDTAAGFAAGVTDYVTKPFKPAHIRSRVQIWLRRKRPEAEST